MWLQKQSWRGSGDEASVPVHQNCFPEFNHSFSWPVGVGAMQGWNNQS